MRGILHLSMDEHQWKDKLTPEQYRVLREKGTEAPFHGKYVTTHDDGMYQCAGCGSPLFSSQAKFDSGTGWPSFDEVASLDSVEVKEDRSHGMNRLEVLCRTCGGHLGHVFDDGQTKTGKRYCINSCSLDLKKDTRDV